MGGEEVVVGESQVGGEEAIVGKAEVGGEEAVRGEAGVGGEEEVAVEDVMLDEAEVVVEDENDEGSYAKKLDDSEEERVADDDDEFGMDIQERVRNIRSILERWKAMRKNSITVKSKRDVGEGSFMTNADIGVHDISEEYDTNELDFDIDSDELGTLKITVGFSSQINKR